MSRYAAQVRGVDDVIDQLKATRDELKAAAREGVFRSAKRAEGRAKAKVRRKSGLLADSIDTFMRKGAARARVGVHKRQAAAAYAPAIEFGTERTPAYPFLFNSLMEERQGLAADVSAALRSILR
jgi:HK97 gp10 family phage protein